MYCFILWRLSPDTGHYSGSFGERNPREVRVGGGGGHLPKAPSQETGVCAQVGVVRGAFQAEGTASAKAQRWDSRCAGESWSGELGLSGEAGGRCGLLGSKEPGS